MSRFLFALAVGSFALSIHASAAEYTLLPSPQTVHVGYFSASLKPVLTIASGDVVTLEASCNADPADVDKSGVVPPGAVRDYTRAIFREISERRHIMTGPIYVNGAMASRRDAYALDGDGP